MNIDEIVLTCIKDKESGTYCVYTDNIKGLIVQVDDLKDAAKEMAKSFEVMLEYGFETNKHIIEEI